MLYDIILKIGYYEIVISSIRPDDFRFVLPIIDNMKCYYDDEEKPIKIELKRSEEPANGEDG